MGPSHGEPIPREFLDEDEDLFFDPMEGYGPRPLYGGWTSILGPYYDGFLPFAANDQLNQ